MVTRQSDQLERLFGCLVAFIEWDTLDLESESNVGEHVLMREQTEVLKDHSSLVPAKLLEFAGIESRDIFPGDDHFPVCWFDQPVTQRMSVDLPEPIDP